MSRLINHKVDDLYMKILSHFNWVSDEKQYGHDDWRSHADAIRNDKDFSDDCDGFAMTCAELLDEMGYPTRLVLCQTIDDIWHMVCGVGVDGVWYYCDNRSRFVSTEDAFNYDWDSYIPYIMYREGLRKFFKWEE